MNRKELKGALLVLLAAIFWGIFPTFNRLLNAQNVSALAIPAVRLYFSSIIYIIWGFSTGKFKGIKLKSLPYFFLNGVCSVLCTYVFYSLAIERLSSAMAASLLYTSTAFIIIFNRIIYKEKITVIKISALLLTLCGSFLVVRAYDFSQFQLNITGIIFGLLSGVAYSSLTVFSKKGLTMATSEQNTMIPTMFAALVMLFIVPPNTIPVNNTTIIVCYIAITLIGSVFPYLLYIKGISMGVEGSTAGIISNMEPVVATICGCVIFSDSLEFLQIIGMILIISGASLPSLGAKNAC